jgi:ATP-dependent Lon protease
MEERIAKGDLPPHVKQTAEEEFRKLKSMGSRNPETDIVRSYLKLILDLPWTKVVEETLSLERAQTILDRDHCGLTKVK